MFLFFVRLFVCLVVVFLVFVCLLFFWLVLFLNFNGLTVLLGWRGVWGFKQPTGVFVVFLLLLFCFIWFVSLFCFLCEYFFFRCCLKFQILVL